MKVILAGYPKTGTKTMRAAFLELGFSNYDFPENCQYLRKDWMKIFTTGGTTEDFRRMFENVDTCTDMPCCYFWEEIHQAFPDAKIILTQRENEDIWWRSFKKQMATGDGFLFKILPYLSPTYYLFNKFLKKMSYVVFGTFGSEPWFGENVISEVILKGKYRRHNAHVLLNAPPNKLLVFKIEDGWGPLCEFLGLPQPDTPFPHSNRGAKITEEWMAKHPFFLGIQSEMSVTICSLLIGGIAAACWKWNLFGLIKIL